mmetsp:Transcript_41384/g.90870  ORF Transcript_41384/g.90870 Transcript_41384/m.90870 type:complete len:222 (+) Transcript_41384:497-1162(+)
MSTCVGHVSRTHDALDLLRRIQIGGESRVYAENLLVHHSRKRQHVKHLLELLPHFDIVATLAFIIEAIDPVDGSTLVVPAKQEKVLRILDLVSEQQTHALQSILPAVHIVPEEEVVCVRREAAVFEKTQQVMVLTMDVSNNLDGSLKLKQSRLVNKQRRGFINQVGNLIAGEIHCSPRLLFPCCQQLLNDAINFLRRPAHVVRCLDAARRGGCGAEEAACG